MNIDYSFVLMVSMALDMYHKLYSSLPVNFRALNFVGEYPSTIPSFFISMSMDYMFVLMLPLALDMYCILYSSLPVNFRALNLVGGYPSTIPHFYINEYRL